MKSICIGIPSAGRADLCRQLCETLAEAVSFPIYVAVREEEERQYEEKLDIWADLVVVIPEGPGVHYQRNALFDAASLGECDYLIQVDDDVSFFNTRGTLEALVSALDTYPWLGAVSSCPDFFYRPKETFSSDPETFRIVASFFQATAIRVSALEEVGPYRLPAYEDVEMSYRLWRAGWAVARLNERGHKPLRPRINRTAAQGGFGIYPPEEWEEMRKNGLEYIGREYADVAKVSPVQSKKALYRTLTDWKKLTLPVSERWGRGLYGDSRNRII